MFQVLFLAFPIPLIGTVVRYRTTYYPKPVNDGLERDAPTPHTQGKLSKAALTDSSNDVTPTEASAVDLEAGTVPAHDTGGDHPTLSGPPTFSGVLRSVWKHSEFEGLFQGYLPHITLHLFQLRVFASPAPLYNIDNPMLILALNLLYMVVLITTYRLIVSPHKFRVAKPKTMFLQTFTEYERAHPFRSLQYSGIVVPFVISFAVYRCLYTPLHKGTYNLDTPFYTPDGQEDEWYKFLDKPNWGMWLKIAAHFGLLGLATLLWTPVHVVITRLAIQPVHGPPNSELSEEKDTHKLLERGVIAAPSYLHLTTEQKPYYGFIDCFKRTIQEEGWAVLYRSWFLTFLGFWIPPLA